MHAAVGDEPEQVQPPARAARRPPRSTSFSKNEPSSIASSMRSEVLPHDRAGAEVEVADLGVAHLAVGQPDGAARRR